MTPLKSNPTLTDLQNYMREVKKERNWNDNPPAEIFLLLTEEVGELAKAIRKHEGLYDESNAKKTQKQFELEEEFADVLSYLFDLANHFDVELETAFRKKEAINEKRTWITIPKNIT